MGTHVDMVAIAAGTLRWKESDSKYKLKDSLQGVKVVTSRSPEACRHRVLTNERW
jgi:hypothetical protein